MLLGVPVWLENVMNFIMENIIYFCIAIGVLIAAEIVIIAVGIFHKKKGKKSAAVQAPQKAVPAEAMPEEAATESAAPSPKKEEVAAALASAAAEGEKKTVCVEMEIKVPVAQPKEEEPSEKRASFADPDRDDDLTETKFDAATNRYIVIKYSKSFLAKLIQSKDETKSYYAELKNEILSYEKVKGRVSWKHEMFRVGRAAAVRMQIRGKTLRLNLALDPAAYADTKYRVEDVSAVQKNADVPAMYRIISPRRVLYAKDLIADVMQKLGVKKKAEFTPVDYAADYPYEENEPLIERELIKVLTDEEAQSGTHFATERVVKEVSVTEVNALISDEEVETYVVAANRVADRTKRVVVNIDTLSEAFQAGETVTLEEIKKRIPAVSKKATYYKVLARGRLNKALTVDADDYSVEAEKMIVVTGGTVLRSTNG